jgi:hypothetical protein
MSFAALPRAAAWHHRQARDGFEVVFFETDTSHIRLHGHTAAVEDGTAWTVRYDITLDRDWHTQRARVWATSTAGEREVSLEVDGMGGWVADGSGRSDLDGYLDVDLESSACTNTIPVHRMDLAVGEAAEAPAVYVRAPDLTVEPLEQLYARVDAEGPLQRYDYSAPVFDFESRLVYDQSALVLEYPGIASRAH